MLQNNKKLLMLYGAITVLMFSLQWIIGPSMIFFAGGMLLILASLLLPFEDEISYCMLLIPNVNIIKSTSINAAIVGYVCVIIAIKFFLIFEKRKDTNAFIFVALFIHLLCVVISVIYTGNKSLLSSLVRFSAFIYICIALTESNFIKLKENCYNFLEMYIFGATVNILLSIVSFISNGKNILESSFVSINSDRNYMSVMLAITIQLLLLNAYYKCDLNLFSSAELFVLVIGGILSQSRTFLLISIPAIIILICLLPRLKGNLKMIIIFPVVILVGYYIYQTFLGDQISKTLLRFEDETVSDGNGRLPAWEFYLSNVFSSIFKALFGVGSTGSAISNGLVAVAEHNTIIQALYNIGTVGVGTLVAVFVNIYKFMNSDIRNIKIIYFLPLVTIIAGYCTLSGLYSDVLNFSIILTFISMRLSADLNYKIVRLEKKGV